VLTHYFEVHSFLFLFPPPIGLPIVALAMADPITVTTTIITLATFITDLIDLGQNIKRSIEKVPVQLLLCAFIEGN
jgi:hypothetical protein